MPVNTDWHFFLNLIPHNRVAGTYGIFKPVGELLSLMIPLKPV
ncbi:hypothetical protein [Microcoleus sp. FACHB-68]|nr:hypothetical protein [Microcoleus sp. FACHB-68]